MFSMEEALHHNKVSRYIMEARITIKRCVKNEASRQNEASRHKEKIMEKDKSVEMAKLAIAALEEKKAEDIRVIDISEVSVIADYFIIAGGSNRNQIQALCDNVLEKLGRAGYPEKQVEGYNTANWVLIDFVDVIVHIFDRENRLLYDLERIWRDGRQVDLKELE